MDFVAHLIQRFPYLAKKTWSMVPENISTIVASRGPYHEPIHEI